ncbi:MAG TPA: LuxR C-terminal-related transcriptional regulator, partial [Candidatus Limnocylindrales bacterium]
ATGAVVNELLDGCPYLRVVATSRTPLRVRGESVVRVQPLGPDAAVELFVLRARAAEPSFRPGDDSAVAIAEICRRLAGLPLAIELAAAHVGALTPPEIAARLGPGDGLLRTDRIATRERQQSLDETLEWSHRLLSPDEQRLFRRLSVFTGGWTLDAAEAVCSLAGDLTGVAAAMGALVEQSLVVRDRSGASERFRFLQPIAEFAARKLAHSSDAGALALPHAQYYLALAGRRVPGPVHATPEDLDRIAVDYDNCVAALRFAEAAAVLPLVAGLVGGLVEFWRVRGHLREALPHLERALQLAGPAPSWPRGFATGVLADFERLLGRLDAAEALARETIEIGDALGDNLYRRTPRGILAEVLAAQGDYAGARAAYEEARRILEEEPNPIALGFYHVGAGLVALRSGSVDDAHAHFAAAVDTLRGTERTWYLGRALAALGAVERRRGELDLARTHLVEGFAELAAYGARVDAVGTIEELGRVALDRGDAERAARMFGAASSLRDSMAIPVPEVERPGLAREIDRSRRSLAPDVFAAAWADGRTQSFEEVARVASEPEVEQAVGIARANRGTGAPSRVNGSQLTRREEEIADLVARGLTNPQIAEELFISPGTARVHVERILGKLGLTSRVQVATWVVEARLGGTPNAARNMSPDGRAGG